MAKIFITGEEKTVPDHLVQEIRSHGHTVFFHPLLTEESGTYEEPGPEVLLVPADNICRTTFRDIRNYYNDPVLPVLVILPANNCAEKTAQYLYDGASDFIYAQGDKNEWLARIETHLAYGEKKHMQRMEQRFEYAVAECASLLADNEDTVGQFSSVISVLQKAAGVSRVYIFMNTLQNDVWYTSQTHESCAPDAAPQINNPDLQNFLFSEGAPNMFAVLKANRPYVGLVDELNEPERSLLGAQQIKSILTLPVFCGGFFWGFLGFDDCENLREWTEKELQLLRITAETISLALERKNVDERLSDAIKKNSHTFKVGNTEIKK